MKHEASSELLFAWGTLGFIAGSCPRSSVHLQSVLSSPDFLSATNEHSSRSFRTAPCCLRLPGSSCFPSTWGLRNYISEAPLHMGGIGEFLNLCRSLNVMSVTSL